MPWLKPVTYRVCPPRDMVVSRSVDGREMEQEKKRQMGRDDRVEGGGLEKKEKGRLVTLVGAAQRWAGIVGGAFSSAASSSRGPAAEWRAE